MAGAARDNGTARAVRATGKKKRREQGKMLRGAQFSEHRGRYSPSSLTRLSYSKGYAKLVTHNENNNLGIK
jgi:hypothetical protein